MGTNEAGLEFDKEANPQAADWDRLEKIKADVFILKNAYAQFADQYEQDRFDRIIKCAEYLARRK